MSASDPPEDQGSRKGSGSPGSAGSTGSAGSAGSTDSAPSSSAGTVVHGEEVEDHEAPHALPPMDFSMFVMSLGSSAMVTLGQVPPPGGEQVAVDLAAAKQIIDILGILEEKTRGNLDDSEKKLLCSVLYDLRVHYVDAKNKK